MAVVTDFLWLDLMVTVIPLFLLYWYITNNYDYWDKRGVPNIKGGLIIDSILGRRSQFDQAKKLYKEFDGEKYGGFFQLKQPVLMVRDLDLINKILVKDFVYFPDRIKISTENDPLSKNLFNMCGQTWRTLRYKLTPTFSTGKLRGMYEQLSKCGDGMMEKIEKLSLDCTEIESKAFVFEFTLDVIASCAFGVQFKPNSPESNEFRSLVKQTLNISPWVFLKFIILVTIPKLAIILDLRFFPRNIENYFTNLTKATLSYRKTNNIQRNDYFQLLIALKEQEDSGKDMCLSMSDTSEDDLVINQMQHADSGNPISTSNVKVFTEDSICANTFIFLTAGSESAASTISLTLFELSRHPDIQQRLQTEVDSVLAKHGGWSYDTIRDMTYLDQVIQEVQRFYPVLATLTRDCAKSYKVLDSDLIIEKGVTIMIPVIGLHMDPQHYPEPEMFKPERFKGNNFKPNSAFLPFGDGPRICIAMRFAVMEVKTSVARIMSQYSVKLSPKTQVPLQFEPRSVFPLVKGGMWLTFEKRAK